MLRHDVPDELLVELHQGVLKHPAEAYQKGHVQDATNGCLAQQWLIPSMQGVRGLPPEIGLDV